MRGGWTDRQGEAAKVGSDEVQGGAGLAREGEVGTLADEHLLSWT